MSMVSQSEGLMLLSLFAASMISLVFAFSRGKSQSHEQFLLAGRNLGWVRGALSIAVSWIWAPAVFVASLQAYTKGLAGAFWFIAPNIICFFIFAPVALKLRRLLPKGYTLPEFVIERFGFESRTHLAFVTLFFGYQLFAITINALAGGILLHTLAGIDLSFAIAALSAIALMYSLVSGLNASVLTDVIQMLLILVVSFVLVPWVFIESGGWTTLASGFGGFSGQYADLLSPEVAFSFGIPMTLTLIAGPFVDQMFFQRSFAVEEKQIVRTFFAGGIVFGLVPMTLCLLGFIAASPAYLHEITVSDPQMVGPLVIAHFLPKWALLLFTFMAFAGLCSTLDSAYCAVSSLGAIDIYRRYFNQEASCSELLRASRAFMVLIGLIGTSLALMQPKLLWLFLISGAMASAGFFPTVLSIYWKSLSEEGVFWAIVAGLTCGLPLSIYANISESSELIVLSSLYSAFIGLIICVLSVVLRPGKWMMEEKALPTVGYRTNMQELI